MQFTLGIGHLARLESRRGLRAQIGGDEIVRGFLSRVDVKAFAYLQHHRDLKHAAASNRVERSKGTPRQHVAARRDVLGRRCRPGYTDEDARKKRNAESQTVTCCPSCCEITRPITLYKSSPVFSSTKECRESDQPSLKLVESAEIHISRTGVFGEMTNLASSGSSKITSSLPLSPSTSKPCSSPSASKRRFNSSKAASA